jgi:hypothetical protein
MWQQFLAQPWVRGVTATRVTALQFPSHIDGRAGLPPGERRAELEAWRGALATEEGRARFERSAQRALIAQASGQYLLREELEEALASAESRLAAAEASLLAVGSTRTWRLRGLLWRISPLRALARATARDQAP